MSLMPLPAPAADGRHRVLIIEDDPFIGRLIMTNLVKANLNCRLAVDGIDGLAEFKNFEPHLVLSDIMMPGMDGRQLCATLRQISRVPIILITAADTSEAEMAAFKAGADDYIPKPFDPILMMTRVWAAMRRVYHYDAPATISSQQNAAQNVGAAPVQNAQVNLPNQATSEHWVTCGMCGNVGPRSNFAQENARGQRTMLCPKCGEREHFSFHPHAQNGRNS